MNGLDLLDYFWVGITAAKCTDYPSVGHRACPAPWFIPLKRNMSAESNYSKPSDVQFEGYGGFDTTNAISRTMFARHSVGAAMGYTAITVQHYPPGAPPYPPNHNSIGDTTRYAPH